jgi:host factor-I protein
MNVPGPEKKEHVEKPSQNIQDGFLNAARKERLQVTIYLVSGVKLTGRVRSFDKFSLVLESNNQEQLIFKHAISTIALPRPLAGASAPAPEGDYSKH